MSRALHELGATPPRGAPLGAPLGDDPVAQRYAQLAAFAQAISAAASSRPIALILDDVPAGSPLDALGDFLVRASIPNVSWIESKSGAAMTLAPLDATCIDALIRAARPLRPLDSHAANAVYATAAGHPAATLALLAAYPGDALVQAATRGELKAVATTLDAATRASLAAISVFKRGAPLALLREVIAEAQLTSLIDRGLVVPRGSTLETTQSVPLTELDAGFAARLTDILLRTPDAEPVALAYLALARDDRPSAERYALKGGEQAERELRHAEAYAIYEAVYARAPSSALAFASARAAIALGRFDDALVRVSAATDHPEQRALAADALITLGRYSEANDLLSPPASDGEPEARLAATRARALMLAGRYDDAQRFAEERMALRPHDPRRVDLLNVAGVSRFFTGAPERARALLTEALTLATDARTSEATRANLALVLHRSGELKAAEDAYTKCVADLEARGDLPHKLLRLTNLAILRQELGSFATALASYEEAAQLARLTANDRALVRVLLNLANLAAWLGNHSEAAPYLAEAVAIADRLVARAGRARLPAIGRGRKIAIANGDTPTALCMKSRRRRKGHARQKRPNREARLGPRRSSPRQRCIRFSERSRQRSTRRGT